MKSPRSPGRPPRQQLLVFTEGKVTEPTYLNAWARRVRERVIIHLDERTGLDPRGLVELAVETRRTELREERRHRGQSHDAYWCVFDVDEHTRLREALDVAQAHDIKVALSNPNFELWILLHHRDQTAALTKDDTRRFVRDEMGIDKSLPPGVIESLMAAHGAAEARATRLDEMHLRNGSDGNPSTGVPALIATFGQP